MKKIWLYGNWKMNKTVRQTEEFILSFQDAFTKQQRGYLDIHKSGLLDVTVFPPFTSLHSAGELLRGKKIDFLGIGAQNVYFESSGAFTGEISPLMIRDTGCRKALIGHSERRHIFGEGEELIASKVRSCLSEGIIPVLCYGEILEEREKGMTLEIVKRQLISALQGLDPQEISNKIILAYEPVWAIGTGRSAMPRDAQEVCEYSREILEDLFGPGEASKLPILYGGSVKPANGKDLLIQKDVNGVLVGGASLEVSSFLGILDSYMAGE